MTRTFHRLALPAVALAALMAVAPPAAAGTDTGWSPTSSERLAKLPAHYLKKALDRDFQSSGLAAALSDTESMIGLKKQTLADLRAAVDQAQGDLRIELRHQFLAEKRAYLDLVAKHQDLRKRRAEIRIQVYEKLLKKLNREGAGMTPQKVALMQNQAAAQQRFESSRHAVDTRLFQSSYAAESRYAQDYAKNMSAIEKLVQAINEHPMNAQSEIDGVAVTKPDFVRQLIAENEAELAIVDQEGQVLGFMARLVSLDALALSDEVAGQAFDAPDTDGDGTPDQPGDITTAVDLFTSH